MSQKLFSQACLLLLLLSPDSSVPTQNPAQPPVADPLSPNEALELVRLLNTAQAESWLTSSSYQARANLLKHRLVSRQSMPVVVQDDTLGEIRGYKLSVLVSGDGKRYHLALVPVSGCSVAFFSNESGLIYTGKTLGCPAF